MRIFLYASQGRDTEFLTTKAENENNEQAASAK